MKNFLKIFQPFMNACKKSSIPILSYMKVENGTATITDTETWVSFNIPDLPDGLYNLINNEPFKTDADIDDFPVLQPGERTSILAMDTDYILNLAKCVSNDQLRPVMAGIHITNESLAASDAHVLRWFYYPNYQFIKGDFNDIFIPSKPLLIMSKEEPQVTIQKMGTYIEFSFPGCSITQRIVDGVYPHWKSVIPNYQESQTVSFSIYPSQLTDMVKTAKSFGNASELIKVTTTEMIHENIDFKLKKSWEVSFCETPSREPDAIIMPMMINDSPNPSGHDILGFNASLIDRAKGLYRGDIIVGYIEDKTGVNRCLGLWFDTVYKKPFYGTINGVTETPKPEAKPEETTEEMPKPEPAPQVPEETTYDKDTDPNPNWDDEFYQEPEEDQSPETQPAPAPAPDPEPTPEPEPVPTPQPETPGIPRKKVIPAAETIHIVEYSPKAIAVFGSTKQFKDEFLKIWGRWVPLTDPTTGTKRTAWIFSKKREAQVREIIKAA